jgi:hypothetical protein
VVDLTSSQALAIPLLLAQKATRQDAKGRRQRLLAFPDTTHEEAARHFMACAYRASIEPGATGRALSL